MRGSLIDCEYAMKSYTQFYLDKTRIHNFSQVYDLQGMIDSMQKM